MRKVEWLKYGALLVMLAGAIAIYQRAQAQQQQNSQPAAKPEAMRQEGAPQKVELPEHPTPPGDGPGDGKDMVVQLCDGETNLVLNGVEPGTRLSPQQAREASNRLMAMWYAKKDPLTAKAWQQEAAVARQKSKGQTSKKSGGSAASSGGGGASRGQEQVNDFTVRDYSVWKRELEREVAYGNQIFHDDKLVGSTNGVACAMCHPNGANTHPETYPKFQIQLRRVALLRDMINWCIENPSRGKKLDADDPKMRAIEAYIMAQRKGVAMEYGKH